MPHGTSSTASPPPYASGFTDGAAKRNSDDGAADSAEDADTHTT